MSRYIDLSHTIKDGLITYPGLPAPVVCDFFTREESVQKYDHGETFRAVSIALPDAVDIDRLRQILDQLPTGILRIKGFVASAGDGRHVSQVQVTGRRITITDWQAPLGRTPPELALVFVGTPAMPGKQELLGVLRPASAPSKD